jgi:hypothetical protein
LRDTANGTAAGVQPGEQLAKGSNAAAMMIATAIWTAAMPCDAAAGGNTGSEGARPTGGASRQSERDARRKNRGRSGFPY